MIISPSDVGKERDAVEDAIAAWNAHVGGGLDARIEAVRWELHAHPEMGERSQEIINKQLVDECDFGIAIFWSRLGSPTGEHESGSAEEIARLLAHGARVMVYFCTRPVPQKAALDPQFASLQQLKERYQEQGLLGTFETADELKEVVTLHITSLMTSLLLKNRSSAQPIPATGTLTAPLPDVRVKTAAAFAVQGDVRQHVLAIGVENHSPVTFFAQSVVLETSSGGQVFVQKDTLTQRFNAAFELEPGNSLSFHIGPDEHFWKLVDENGPFCAAVKDKIGRVFRGDPDELKSALASLRSR